MSTCIKGEQSLEEDEVRFPEEAYREVKGGNISVGRQLVSEEIDFDSCINFKSCRNRTRQNIFRHIS